MKIGFGHDSHRFDFNNQQKPLVLGGVVVEGHPPLKGNSDADVVYHALANAISGVTCKNILGPIADKMCFQDNIKDSKEYVKEALKYMNGMKICNVSFSIECCTPKLAPIIDQMRTNIAAVLGINENCIGITATTGEELTDFGKGKGILVFCSLLAAKHEIL